MRRSELVSAWLSRTRQRTCTSPASSLSRIYCLRRRDASGVASLSHHAWNHTHTRSTALCPRLPRWAGTRKVKPIWILLKQETVSGRGISWAIRKSALRSSQITMPAPHRSVFFTGRMPFLPPNRQRQSTEGSSLEITSLRYNSVRSRPCYRRTDVPKPRARTYDYIHREAEKRNQFSFECISFNTWQKLVFQIPISRNV